VSARPSERTPGDIKGGLRFADPPCVLFEFCQPCGVFGLPDPIDRGGLSAGLPLRRSNHPSSSRRQRRRTHIRQLADELAPVFTKLAAQLAHSSRGNPEHVTVHRCPSRSATSGMSWALRMPKDFPDFESVLGSEGAVRILIRPRLNVTTAVRRNIARRAIQATPPMVSALMTPGGGSPPRRNLSSASFRSRTLTVPTNQDATKNKIDNPRSTTGSFKTVGGVPGGRPLSQATTAMTSMAAETMRRNLANRNFLGEGSVPGINMAAIVRPSGAGINQNRGRLSWARAMSEKTTA
jgi:hypothetical protein